MKPIKKKALLEIEYWDCGNPDHRHKREDVALRCMEKIARKQPVPESKHDRNIQIARDIVSGKRQIDIAKDIGRSVTTVRNAAIKVFRLSRRSIFDMPEAPCSYYDLTIVPQHKDYWMKAIDKVAEYWGV